VKEGSPALKLGFANFPMDQFGVQKAELKAIARTPQMPKIGNTGRSAKKQPSSKRVIYAMQVQVRDISGLGDRSAYGLPDETGVLILEVPAGSPAAKAGLQKGDVIRTCNGQPVRTVEDLQKLRDEAAGKKLSPGASKPASGRRFKTSQMCLLVCN
jgi:S1-C subfamily serine protease